MVAVLLAAVVAQVAGFLAQILFYISTGWLLMDQMGGRSASPLVRGVFRLTKPVVWYAYVAYVAGLTVTAPSGGGIAVVRTSAIFAVSNALWWWLAKRLKDDDDDWTKRLLDKGTGAVERFGDRLRIVAAPAGAR